MKLMIVKRGRALHWPTQISDPQNRLRCVAGDIIDLDAPLEREVLCDGQMYKLQDAPPGKTAADITPVAFRPAANLIRDERERLDNAGKAKRKAQRKKKGDADLDIDAPKAPAAPDVDPDELSFANVSTPKKPGDSLGGK